jgi:endonuclease YncB( thermonuclease family)
VRLAMLELQCTQCSDADHLRRYEMTPLGTSGLPSLTSALRRNSAAVGTLLSAALLLALGWVAEAQSLRKGDLVSGPAKVVDGGSLDIKSDRIRLWGIDAPERGAWCYRHSRRWKPADDATAALRRCVEGKTVTCRVWSVEQRWFREVHTSECWTADGLDVGECMIRGGWATDYTCFSAGYYQDLETEAKNRGIGLWSCDNGPGTRRWGRGGRDVPCETPRYKPAGPTAK